MNAPAHSAARTAAVGATMDRVKAIEREQGVTREALAAIEHEMLALAAHESLFPAAEFPPPPVGEKGSKRYLLQEDPDGRFAVYLLALNPGNESKPHDHTTWAVVTSVEGQELNRVYRRVDDGSAEGKAEIELVREVMVEPGRGIGLMPEDIHSIHTTGTTPTRHLHCYGLALERLDRRQGFDTEAGTVQPYNKAFMGPHRQPLMRTVSPATLRGWITDGAELALLDAREEGEFGSGHLFWAVPCPLSRARLRLPVLLPRRSVRVVCVDDGRGLAERLAALLTEWGASDVHVLEGGTAGWAAAGYVLFTGVNVPSKAFGEWVEHQYGSQSVDAPELKAWQDEGRDMIVLDSRPMDEFHKMSIPGGINVPGGELAYRVGDLVPDPNTLIVVNCAGRTRSIMGAESLRRAGVPNPVMALRNGTMGWTLAGLDVARGQTERYEAGVPRTAALALERASAFAEASGVGVIGPLDLDRFEEDPARTLYVLDVRDPSEYAAQHRPGSRNAPGGQLIQATDTWVGVRGARIALIDDDGVRARMAAAWLRQMGHRDVFVVEGGLDDLAEAGPAVPVAPDVAEVETIPAGALVLDLARSIDFRAGHIPGAVWGVPTRLDGLRAILAGASCVVVASPDGILARLAAEEVSTLTGAEVLVLRGGTLAWVAAGGALEASREDPPDEACIDFYLRPYDRNSGVEAAMHAYLSWEIDLVREIERDGTVAFGV